MVEKKLQQPKLYQTSRMFAKADAAVETVVAAEVEALARC